MCLIVPASVTVGLVRSVRTISRIPFGSFISVTARDSVGTWIAFSGPAAQSGSTTGLVGAEVACSAPPNPLAATASPLGAGFKMAVDGARVQQVLFGHAVHIGQRHLADGIDILFRRIAALRRQRG